MEQLISQIGIPLIAVLVPLAVAVIKTAWAGMPKWLMPIAAVVLGPVFDIVIHLVSGLEANGALAGALAGLAGIGLRELKDQAVKAVL